MKREDLRVMDLDDEFNDEIVPRPVTDAELAEMGLVALDGIDVETVRRGLEALADSDYETAALFWAKLAAKYLVAIDRDR